MTARSKHAEVQAASQDLRHRTLSQIPQPLDRLLYLASMRDYNTGLYHHDGLASRFSEEAACEALADCHREAYRQLLSSSLEEIVGQLQDYMRTTSGDPAEFLAAWKGLRPYQVAVPAETDPLAAQFLFSNLKVALAILESRFRLPPTAAPVASQPPPPGQ
ncbi:MAG: hypothetical protein WB780_10970 [Candidatus Acidiferrales bacterium]